MATPLAPSRPRSLPRPASKPLTTYLFPVELEHEADGRWSAWITELPGCTTWGYTREEAVRHIREAAELYVGAMAAQHDKLSRKIRSSRAVSVAVTV